MQLWVRVVEPKTYKIWGISKKRKLNSIYKFRFRASEWTHASEES